LEESLPKGVGVSIVDFDLVPEYPEAEPFTSREQVLPRLLALREQVEVRDETTEFIRAKLNASVYYLRLLQGAEAEYYEHVRTMLGITPELIPEDEVDRQRRKLVALLKRLGLRFPSRRPHPADFRAFDDAIRLTKEQAEKDANAQAAKFLPVVLDLLGFPELKVSYRIQLVEEEAYWRGWTSGRKDDLLLRFNFHRNHRWRRGDMEYLTLHEVCGHFVHAALLARRIEAGELDPFIGISSVHDPHGFMGEGIADGLTYFFPDEIPLSPYGVLAREQTILRYYLDNNAHIRVNLGDSPLRLLGYLQRNPFTPFATADLNLQRWRHNPLLRAYQYSYGIACKYHRRFAERMNRAQKVAYLRYAFQRYVTPQRLIDEVQRLTGM
jgi:hypothetical protein